MFNAEGNLLLEEYAWHRLDLSDPKYSSLDINPWESKPILGGDYHLTIWLESVNKNKNIYAWDNISSNI
jgi:alpha-D-xyloside xylohydrolase